MSVENIISAAAIVALCVVGLVKWWVDVRWLRNAERELARMQEEMRRRRP